MKKKKIDIFFENFPNIWRKKILKKKIRLKIVLNICSNFFFNSDKKEMEKIMDDKKKIENIPTCLNM